MSEQDQSQEQKQNPLENQNNINPSFGQAQQDQISASNVKSVKEMLQLLSEGFPTNQQIRWDNQNCLKQESQQDRTVSDSRIHEISPPSNFQAISTSPILRHEMIGFQPTYFYPQYLNFFHSGGWVSHQQQYNRQLMGLFDTIDASSKKYYHPRLQDLNNQFQQPNRFLQPHHSSMRGNQNLQNFPIDQMRKEETDRSASPMQRFKNQEGSQKERTLFQQLISRPDPSTLIKPFSKEQSKSPD